jgi:hypothetical protein
MASGFWRCTAVYAYPEAISALIITRQEQIMNISQIPNEVADSGRIRLGGGYRLPTSRG